MVLLKEQQPELELLQRHDHEDLAYERQVKYLLLLFASYCHYHSQKLVQCFCCTHQQDRMV